MARWPAVAALLAPTACSDASGAIDGGEPTLLVTVDESPPDPLPASCKDGGPNTGSGWNDLYTCYFGPTGIANCAGGGVGAGCHASSGDLGGLASKFACPPEGDAGTCYDGILALVPDGSAADPTISELYRVLRKSDGMCMALRGTCMPAPPFTVEFQPRDMNRIAAWLGGGAQKN
jgi:hypothetical protein